MESSKGMSRTNNLVCVFCESSIFRKTVSTKSFKILACTKCGIAVTLPSPVLPKYEEMDFHADTEVTKLSTIDNLPKDWQKSIQAEIEIVKNFIPAGSAILEIGCGDGLLLSELQKLQYDCFGIEPSLSATKRAVFKGLNVSQGYFPEIMPKQKMDLVILTHVFEHIANPNSFIESVKKALIPGGYLLFAQTNYKGLIPKLQGKDWYAWVPEHHFWHFTLKGMTRYLAKNGFTLSESKYISLVHPKSTAYKIAQFFPRLRDQFIAIYKYDNEPTS